MILKNSKTNEIEEEFQGKPKEIDTKVLNKDEGQTMKGENQ